MVVDKRLVIHTLLHGEGSSKTPLRILFFSVAHAAQGCPTTTDDLDVACGRRMVKSVVAAVSANPPDQRPSVPDQRPSVPDQRSNASDPRSEQVCLLYNSGRCMYAKCRRRHVCSSCAGSHPITACTRSRPYLPSNKPLTFK